MTESVIRLLLADDHPVVLHGLASLLQRNRDIRVVAEPTKVRIDQVRTELAKGTRSALAPLKKEIPAAEREYMPTRYGEILAASTTVTNRVTAGETLRATVKVHAQGKTESRDVTALNRGTLRHPRWGDRKHWYAQRVRPGIVDDPVEEARKRVVANAEDARDHIADKILRE